MTKNEALKMAIDFLDGSYEAHKVRKACQEALEQPAQEPVAWMAVDEISGEYMLEKEKDNGIEWTPLYAHPAPSWQGLNNDEIINIIDIVENEHSKSAVRDIMFFRAIEAKIKEKNHDIR